MISKCPPSARNANWVLINFGLFECGWVIFYLWQNFIAPIRPTWNAPVKVRPRKYIFINTMLIHANKRFLSLIFFVIQIIMFLPKWSSVIEVESLLVQTQYIGQITAIISATHRYIITTVTSTQIIRNTAKSPSCTIKLEKSVKSSSIII